MQILVGAIEGAHAFRLEQEGRAVVVVEADLAQAPLPVEADRRALGAQVHAVLDIAPGHRHRAEHLEQLRRRRAQLLGQREAVDQDRLAALAVRSEEHTSELQSLMRISYAVFCLKKKTHKRQT